MRIFFMHQFNIIVPFVAAVWLLGWSSMSYAANPHRDITEQLPRNAKLDAIVEHLVHARKTASVTRALALQFPDLDRDQAYKIQMALLEKLLADGERLVGWKMGGTLAAKPEVQLDPIFGFMLASDEYKSGSTILANRFCEDASNIEAELCFWISKDLPGPRVSREQLKTAIGGVGGASELISVRVRDARGGRRPRTELAIADGLSLGGFIRPAKKVPLAEANLKEEIGHVHINGQRIATGRASAMMNGAPIDAVFALANCLPQYGRSLRAGDIVIIGSMLDSPIAKSGDQAEIRFSTYGTLNINLK